VEPRKTDLPAKLKLPEKRAFKLMEKRRAESSALQPTPLYKLRMKSMVWNIFIGQLELAAWLCSLPALVHPAHQLNMEDWKKSLIS